MKTVTRERINNTDTIYEDKRGMGTHYEYKTIFVDSKYDLERDIKSHRVEGWSVIGNRTVLPGGKHKADTYYVIMVRDTDYVGKKDVPDGLVDDILKLIKELVDKEIADYNVGYICELKIIRS